jgi:hypothetical protein
MAVSAFQDYPLADRGHLAKYYAKMGEDAPWERD